MTTVGARTPRNRRERSPEAVIACSWRAAPGVVAAVEAGGDLLPQPSLVGRVVGEPITLNSFTTLST